MTPLSERKTRRSWTKLSALLPNTLKHRLKILNWAPAEDIKLGLPYIDRDGKLMADDIKTQIDWYSSHGMMQGELDPAKVANTALLEKALAK